MSKRILIVGAGHNQVGVIAKAHDLGYETVAVDGNPEAPGLRTAGVGVAADICSAEALTEVARAHGVDGIYPAAELGVEAAAAVATALGLPGVAPETAERVRNKARMRECLASQGIPTPGFREARDVEEAIAAFTSLGAPVIVKPADGNASKGVQRVDAVENIPAAFRRAAARTRVGSVLLETFMEGEEYNVDGLVFEGRYILGGMTAKERSAPPDRFDWGIYMPPLEAPDVLDAIEETVAAAYAAIGFRTGTTHAEVIVTSEGPRIVEMAGRPGGGRIPTDLIPLTYGMDFTADSLRIAMGEAPVEQRRFERGTALYWFPVNPGVLERIEGIEEARALPGVLEVVPTARVGERLEAVVDCATRDKVGYVLTAADSVEEAVAVAKQARVLCRFVTRPVAPSDMERAVP